MAKSVFCALWFELAGTHKVYFTRGRGLRVFQGILFTYAVFFHGVGVIWGWNGASLHLLLAVWLLVKVWAALHANAIYSIRLELWYPAVLLCSVILLFFFWNEHTMYRCSQCKSKCCNIGCSIIHKFTHFCNLTNSVAYQPRQLCVTPDPDIWTF